jgi:hypothetical protein
VFASLFKRAEASVDNAIADLGARIIITIPFLIALGFGAASLSTAMNRMYGNELGNLIVAAAFVLVGCAIAIVVRVRSRSKQPIQEDEEPAQEQAASSSTAGSMFDNESVMSIVSSAAPILLPALLRTATKNWPLVLAVAGGLYVFSLSDSAAETPPAQPPQS